MQALFYASWVLLRLVWYPYLAYDFFQRYLAKSAELQTLYNPYVLGPIFQLALVGLNVHWTLSLLIRVFSGRPRPKQA